MPVSSDKSTGAARGDGGDSATLVRPPESATSLTPNSLPIGSIGDASPLSSTSSPPSTPTLPSSLPSPSLPPPSPGHQPLPWLTIVGIGEDGTAGLGEAARMAITAADHVFGGTRHLSLAASLIRGTAHPWPTPFDADMTCVVAKRDHKVCVLASGDPFLHGVGATLSRVIDAREMHVYPAPSAFSLAAARMAWPLQDVVCLSLHTNGPETLRRQLQPGRRIIALTSGAKGPAEIARYLCQQGFGSSTITVFEALGGSQERTSTHRAHGFGLRDINPLNVLAIKLAATQHGLAILPLAPGLPEDCFEHDGQITKRDVRSLTISALQPHRGDYLWDVGAGSGSVAIEWLLAHPSMRAVAIEASAERAARITRNATSLGVPALEVVEGRAPDALLNLPVPDAIFVGGGGTMPGVMEAAIEALNSGGRLVANGVTLEMERILSGLYARHGGRLIQINLCEAGPLGKLTTWRPALPIVQWSWSKP